MECIRGLRRRAPTVDPNAPTVADFDVLQCALPRKKGDRVLLVQAPYSPLYASEGLDAGDNYVISSSYTWYNFVFLNLFEQFCNLANLYFLVIGILQLIPAVTTTGGIPTMYEPLSFILMVSAARSASEDYAKHRADAKRNGKPYEVLSRDGDFALKPCGKLRVGDIVRVRQDEMIPADMLLLGSSLAKGHCFIDKANVNGETTLEVLTSLHDTRAFCANSSELCKLKVALSYEPPNKHFEKFRGVMRVFAPPVPATLPALPAKDEERAPFARHSRSVTGSQHGAAGYGAISLAECGSDSPASPSAETPSPSKRRVVSMKTDMCTYSDVAVTGKSMMMRETNLKNCGWIVGLVVYAGADTKIELSNAEGGATPVKKSRIMSLVERYLKRMLALQTLMCAVSGAYSSLWLHTHKRFASSWLLLVDESLAKNAVYAFFSWFILLSQMVPISLLVSAEMVKFVLSIFIGWDTTMYSPSLDKPTKCNVSTIHEDLGLIDYVFSDKTGTLTQNRMEFRYALPAQGGPFGSKDTEIAKSVRLRKQLLAERLDQSSGSSAPPPPPVEAWSVLTAKAAGRQGATAFTDAERDVLLRGIWGASVPPLEREAALRYMTHMALSNTVRPYEHEGELRFQSESAEELAMVQFARSCGFTKLSVNPTVLEIQTYTDGDGDSPLQKGPVKQQTYRHLATMGFTSARARVSIVLQRIDEDGGEDDGPGYVHVMTKGQDTVIVPLLTGNWRGDINEGDLLKELQVMCANGLRTLVCAYARLPLAWWEARAADYQAAEAEDETQFSQGHSAGTCNSQRCEKCQLHTLLERYEKEANLRYAGAIGLEDQLQDLVPETIYDCVRAGIRVWMITGDKLETAMNIGMACNLIDADMLASPTFADGGDDRTIVSNAIRSYREARLLEITGHWARLLDDEDELLKLFEMFDFENTGSIDIETMAFVLGALNFNVDGDRLAWLMDDRGAAGGDAEGGRTLNAKQFVALMRSCELSMYEAVRYDIDEGIKRYNAINDHDAYPVSILFNADAFNVLFPDGAKKTSSAFDAAGQHVGKITGMTREALVDLRLSMGRGMRALFGRGDSAADGEESAAAAAAAAHSSEASGKSAAQLQRVSEAELDELRHKFFLLASVSKSVVFARAQPVMKKRIVTEIRQRVPAAVTLAIGDGANDADMIRAAHVGVGIAGVEGTAATNASDYAIGTFSMLHTLLFVHGYYCYHRISMLTLFIFYKASLLSITAYYFGFFSGFSGQQFFNDPLYQLYNVLFTAAPILVVAVFDQVLPRAILQDNPLAYRAQKGTLFSSKEFIRWIARVIIHSAIIFFVPMMCLGALDVNGGEGGTSGIWYSSTVIYVCVVTVPTLLVVFVMHTITLLHLLSVFVSLIFLLLLAWVLNLMISFNSDLFGVTDRFYSQPRFWMAYALCVAIPLLLELAWRGLRTHLRPTMAQVVLERLRAQEEEGLPWGEIARRRAVEAEEKHRARAATRGDAASRKKKMEAPLLADREGAVWDRRRGENKLTLMEQRRRAADTELRAFATADAGADIGDPSSGTPAADAQLRATIIRAVLKFRKLTGATFDSAAQGRLQDHDDLATAAAAAAL